MPTADRQSDASRLKVALTLLLLFMTVEVVAGVLTSSLALLSDAAHMLTDAAALALALVAARLAARPAKGALTFGLGRAEILSAQLNGMTLLVLSVLIIYAMVGRELWHAVEAIATISDVELVILLCSVLDMVLIANLLVMVGVSSYESYISRIEAETGRKPEWLGKLDSGNVKVKVAVSVAMTRSRLARRAAVWAKSVSWEEPS